MYREWTGGDHGTTAPRPRGAAVVRKYKKVPLSLCQSYKTTIHLQCSVSAHGSDPKMWNIAPVSDNHVVLNSIQCVKDDILKGTFNSLQIVFGNCFTMMCDLIIRLKIFLNENKVYLCNKSSETTI